MLRWYLVYTKPSRETVALANLERQHYEVYFPRLIEPVRRDGRWHERVVPLFPRYLFLRLDEGNQPLGPVRSSIGVASVVRNGSGYAIVPDQVICDLRARAEPDSGLHRMNRPAPFAPGTAVRITMRPFNGLEAIFEQQVAADRVVVLLNLLGRETHLQIPADFVVPSSTAA